MYLEMYINIVVYEFTVKSILSVICAHLRCHW